MPRSRSQRERHWWDFHPSESALWSVELVCKTWRHIVLDFPQLWSRIIIFINDANFSPHNLHYVRKLVRQVARTRGHPFINPDMRRSSPGVGVFLELCRLSFPRSCSPCMIEYNLSISFLPAPLFTSMANLRLRMPILRNLALLSTNGEEFGSLIHMETIWRRATPKYSSYCGYWEHFCSRFALPSDHPLFYLSRPL